MKITVDKKELLDGLQAVNNALPSTTSMPILENIKISVAKEGITLTGSDLDMAIEYSMEAHSNIEESVICVPGKLFRQIISTLNGDTIELSLGDNYSVLVKSNGTNLEVQGYAADQYPEIPTVNTGTSVNIAGKTLQEMIKNSISCIASDTTRPVLTGGYLIAKEGVLTIVALDGYRMAVMEHKDEGVNAEFDVIVPKKTLQFLMSLGGDDVTISVSDTQEGDGEPKHLVAQMGTIKVVTRLLSGTFIDYKPLMAKGKSTFNANPVTLLNSVRRASLISREGSIGMSNLVTLDLAGTLLNVSSRSDVGNLCDIVPMVDYDGEDLQIAFNADYLADILKNVDEEIEVSISTALSPITIEAVGHDEDEIKIFYLILPVRVS